MDTKLNPGFTQQLHDELVRERLLMLQESQNTNKPPPQHPEKSQRQPYSQAERVFGEECIQLYEKLKKKLKDRNKVIYDSCCFNLTYRSRTAEDNHPKENQIPLRKLFHERNITSGVLFAEFMVDELRSLQAKGKRIEGLSENEPHEGEVSVIDPVKQLA